jgi:hypothetical protein
MPRWENTKPKRRGFRGDADVHRKLHGDADADRGTVHCRNDGFERLEDAKCQLAAAVAHTADRCSRSPRSAALFTGPRRASRSKVLAPEERSAPAQKPRPSPVTMMALTYVVLVGGVEGVDHFLLHRGVEGVELVRPVQRDGEDLLGDLVFDRLIRHGVSSRSFSFFVGWVERSETH